MISEEEYERKVNDIVNKDYNNYLNRFVDNILNETSKYIDKITYNIIYSDFEINIINIIKSNMSKNEFRLMNNYIYEDYLDYDQFIEADDCTQKSILKSLYDNNNSCSDVLKKLNIN